MKVFFLTEGGEGIGFGHITRCLAISKAFEKKRIKTCFIVNGDGSIKSLIKDTDFKILNWINEIDKFASLVDKEDIIFIDSYLANKDVYNQISKLAKIVAYLDDNNRINYPKGIVINGNINALSIKYTKNLNKNFLLGSDYAPIREEFWDIPKIRLRKKIKSVLLTFGHGDVGNLTPRIIKTINKIYPELLISVIVGPGFKSIKELKNIKSNNVNLVFSPSAGEIKKLMINSDFIVSASGQTVNEILRVNKPGIIISVADNQNNTFKYLKKNKVLSTLEKENVEFVNELEKLIRRMCLYKNRAKFLRKTPVVDGKGPKRIVEFCLSLNKKKILFLTNNKNTYVLADWLKISGDDVRIFQEKITEELIDEFKPDFLISYNYKYIIPENILNLFDKGKAINLHISYLPWNKGSNPNFWSFVDNTPKGVTIHVLEKGLDTGEIIFQKLINFDEKKETLSSSYDKLHKSIVNLFMKNWFKIKSNQVNFKKQSTNGSYHDMNDFEKFKNILNENDNWNIPIIKLKNLIKKNESNQNK